MRCGYSATHWHERKPLAHVSVTPPIGTFRGINDGQMYIWTPEQMDRQDDKWTEAGTDRKRDRQTGRKRYIQNLPKIDCRNGCTYVWIDQWTNIKRGLNSVDYELRSVVVNCGQSKLNMVKQGQTRSNGGKTGLIGVHRGQLWSIGGQLGSIGVHSGPLGV